MPGIFLDNHSTTPVDPRVLDAMLPYFTEHFGNAASRSHAFGWDAANAVAAARSSVAALIGATRSNEVVFTSGATESNNLALKGVLAEVGATRKHVVVSAIEHKSVLDTAVQLQARGYRVSVLPVNRQGVVELDALADFLSDDTALVSVMLGNNEVGTVQPIAELAERVHARGALLHVDAAQGVGLVDFHVERLHVDLASLSAHKMYGPKGCGALYVRSKRPRVRLAAQIHGGGHELGLRSGTLNVPAIVGFGHASELMRLDGRLERQHIGRMRDTLAELLTSELPDIVINGSKENHLPGNLNVSFPSVDSGSLMSRLGDIAVSSGSACSSATPEPSHVLAAMGIEPELARCSIRFGIGRFNTLDQINTVAERVIHEVRWLRGLGETAN